VSNLATIVRMIETPPLIVRIEQQVIKIRSDAVQGAGGPPGPQGIQGQPGADGTNTLFAFEQVAPIDGMQTITLPYAIASGWYMLCVNGLRQAVSAYSVSGTSLNLPTSLNVLTGDLISFDFYPTI
jgi:hypothetical protein